MRFTPVELEDFSNFLKKEFGLSFSPEKYQQLENRIIPILENFSMRRLSEIVVQMKRNIRLRMDLINALTTNETWFFRHPSHFNILTKFILPELQKKSASTHDNRLKIWSAGCSIGAEPYSLLISLLEAFTSHEKWNISILGSDIASDAIARARTGTYEKQELKLIEPRLLEKYFVPAGHNCFRVREELSRMVEFEVLNLLDSWPARKFDVIFCRNVMIYFSEEHKKQVTDKFLESLNDNGFYLTSANESIHWQTRVGLKKIFVEDEFVYQKARSQKTFRLYRFATPSDLLRALNLLNQSGLSYGLEKIRQTHDLAPKRAIFISQDDCNRADELFSLSDIKVASNNPYPK